jgi:hypothetical protein
VRGAGVSANLVIADNAESAIVAGASGPGDVYSVFGNLSAVTASTITRAHSFVARVNSIGAGSNIAMLDLYQGQPTTTTGGTYGDIYGVKFDAWTATVTGSVKLFYADTTTKPGATNWVCYFPNDAPSYFAGRIGVGVTLPATAFHAVVSDASNASVSNLLTVSHNTSGAPAAGIGAGIDFQSQTSSTPDVSLGGLSLAFSDVSHATRTSNFIINLVSGGSTIEALRVLPTGVTGYSQVAQTWLVGRNGTPGAAGVDLLIRAGGAASAATDAAGGVSKYYPGISTGTGFASVRLGRNKRADSTGSGDNATVDAFVIPSEKLLPNNSTTDCFTVAMPDGGMVGGWVAYTVTVSNGTDTQVHSGHLNYAGVRKGAAFTVSIVDAPIAGEANAISSVSTLTESWTISTDAGGNKITIQAKFNSNLGGSPVLHLYYSIHNGGVGAVNQL